MSTEYRHIPVLLPECLENLDPSRHHIFVDATLGGAGHSLEVARLLGQSGMLIGIDQDTMALETAQARLDALPEEIRPEVKLLHGNFGDFDKLLLEACVPGIDAVLFDLGVSSPQLDLVNRGFSFKEDAPLDMRMDANSDGITARDIVNTYSAADLSRIIYAYSDEKWASRIAEFIVKARESAPIETSGELVEIIKAAIPASARRAGGHPAKRTFQALRIEVNQELDVLERGLEAACRWLNPGGRICVISYHSLEDRIVKDMFARLSNRCTCPPDFPTCACGRKPILKIVARKPIVPTDEEIQRNPRARSAKLRVAERLQE